MFVDEPRLPHGNADTAYQCRVCCLLNSRVPRSKPSLATGEDLAERPLYITLELIFDYSLLGRTSFRHWIYGPVSTMPMGLHARWSGFNVSLTGELDMTSKSFADGHTAHRSAAAGLPASKELVITRSL